MTESNIKLPEEVTFTKGAKLLRDLGIDPYATAASVRHIARTRENWPFCDPGGDKEHEYGQVSNARTMATGPFLDFFRENPPRGRGPDRKPRPPRKVS